MTIMGTSMIVMIFMLVHSVHSIREEGVKGRHTFFQKCRLWCTVILRRGLKICDFEKGSQNLWFWEGVSKSTFSKYYFGREERGYHKRVLCVLSWYCGQFWPTLKAGRFKIRSVLGRMSQEIRVFRRRRCNVITLPSNPAPLTSSVGEAAWNAGVLMLVKMHATGYFRNMQRQLAMATSWFCRYIKIYQV